ncbi:hypothetical protein A3J77_00400 [Candidatus Wolfebacteria bacterium RBG_13_41_7]|uniref:Methenyltetrahydrofolate cyclohydrolase n=1 Tax=Candidatus Wolfebacteria bacterium RBG_13_41_7 TaxID=1802554 RepID=A0A1F8DNB5_9BACT|nr:MAG: hypothetical protein A3J77_00400 [Candidatus Wolfebacteria bacterium RBG_13_41_7]
MPEIPCKEIAQKIINDLRSKPAPKKVLAAVLVGENSASISFLRQKEKAAKELDVDFRIYEFPENILQDELDRKIEELAEQESIGGLIIQLPLPGHIDNQEVLNIIPLEKDIDVLSERAFENFRAGKNKVLPPAVGVVEEIFNYLYENTKIYESTKNLKFVIVGSGSLIGKPISMWLERKIAELIILNSKTENIKEKLKDADVIISGAGKPNLFSAEDVKENAVIIDFGYSFINGKISGDFNTKQLSNYATTQLKYTPTPSGTGPILVVKIMENFYKLNKSE